ncbi:hypothetical protein ACVRXQ_05565 [Streptococcus panodentis]|uniref:Uncharacterized protein n=1 Tax=Streptococcus panodentis TaxID=1581472 RepID=A0ABS5AUI3_9STRE|nr:hypothetical protein [Streptococcus panodentis]MBP2620237.1 hypothetical protein [Streptococcus panodentis]
MIAALLGVFFFYLFLKNQNKPLMYFPKKTEDDEMGTTVSSFVYFMFDVQDAVVGRDSVELTLVSQNFPLHSSLGALVPIKHC